MQLAAGAISINADTLPKGFVHFFFVFFKGDETLTLFDTHFAQFTAGGNVQLTVLVGDSAKGTYID